MNTNAIVFLLTLLVTRLWLYHRFCLSFREVEELLAERGIIVTYESIRRWCLKFGHAYARRLKKCQETLGDAWHLDEVVITMHGEHQYLWRAVDQDGDTIDILVQPRRNKRSRRSLLPSSTQRSRRRTPLALHG